MAGQKVRDFYGKLGILNETNNSCNSCFENPNQKARIIQLALEYIQGVLENANYAPNVSYLQ